MASPREHIEQIRRIKFSIGGEMNPLTEDLHQAVKNLSAELYAKDVHFLMELIQNAEDNVYLEGVDPSLELVITSHDITATGAPATLLIFNNEKGFSSKNIESICSVGRSTKKGCRKRGYIGEKGIGFKSVFLITAQPYIFSNGYQIRFNEGPCSYCNLGYIVPEWVEENPSLSDLQQIYGSGSTLPTTTIVLPLKPDKVDPVKQQLSSIHPEVLLFLSKIKRFSVREDNEDPSLNTVSAIAITSETNFVTRKNIDAESYTLHLSARENDDAFETECSYYMWRQKFPVRQENRVERRMEVDEWVITLAFPNQERLHRGMISPGVYAFLPTEMVTNFPFIIQADFVLASSRETILLDDKWNQGILDCVPLAFVKAFISLVKMTEDAPVSNLPRMFEFLPVKCSPYPKLNAVRESIKAKLVEEDIVPSESYVEQKFFHKPSEVGRIMPAFWDILKKAREQGVSLHNLSSHGWCILNSSFDKQEYDDILNFLGVKPVNKNWYAKCIQSSDLVLGVLEDVYSELLFFIADNWSSNFSNTNIKGIPLLKYEDVDGNVSLFSIKESTQQDDGKMLCLSGQLSWLIDWNRQFRCVANHFFMPKGTLKAIHLCSKKETLLDWLYKQVKVGSVSVYDYAVAINNYLNSDRKLVLAYVHFLYHSFSKSYLSERQVDDLCSIMPLVDNYGSVSARRTRILVPANGSNWAKLIISNPWRGEGCVELSEDYLRPGNFAGVHTTGKQLIEFLNSHLRVSDVPYISPPNAGIPAVAALLTKQNAFLLLDWIRNLKSGNIPAKFLTSIKEGNWLKITMNGSSGCRPPSQSFMPSTSWGNILQNVSVLVDIPLIDQSFYGDTIQNYREELKTIGVMFEFGEACEFIGKRLMSLAASSTLTRGNVLSILNFIQFLREKFLPIDKFICSIKQGRWLRTSHGDRSPVGSVLNNQEWRIASKISNLPFIDQNYYGEEILQFKTELQLLDVKVGFNQNYRMVVDHLKLPSCWASLPGDVLIFCCTAFASSSDKLVNALKNTKCLKTNLGYKSPGECFLFDTEWGCLLQVFSGFPLIDHKFYGSSIFSYKNQLKQLGVVVDFEVAGKAFAHYLKQPASLSSIRKENVMSFLSCYRRLKGTSHKFPQDLMNCIREVKWLRTRIGDFRSPRDCILYGPEWESISPFTIFLPFIDDSNNYYGEAIREYEEELKELKVVVQFKDGVEFVAASLYIPTDPTCITPANVFSLLECIRVLLEKEISFPKAFLKKVSKKWLKTYAGYRAPDECLLFDSKWGSFLKRTDGPFVDEEFYGSNITSYRTELKAIGVIVDVEKGCSLLASHICFHSEFTSIVRIYNFLRQSNWEPDSEADRRIWIPNGSKNGEWVNPEGCVLRDRDGLFGLQLNVLEKHYDLELLNFFSSVFGVKSNPSVDDYCKLWKVWESSGHQLSQAKCCAFWGCVTEQWSKQTERTLAESLVKLPVDLGADGILLLNKSDVFIADDLQLKDLFQRFSPHPIFVWYPQPSLPSLPRTKLLEIYSKIGVRGISESVQKEELSLADGVKLKQVNPRNVLIDKGLVRLVLGFLADPSFKMEAEKRQKAVQQLLNLSVLKTVEPITVRYTLSLSSGEIVNVKASRMIRWDRESSKLFAQKMDRSGGQKNLIEYATYFSEVIAKGVLWEKEDHVSALSELIKLAFLLDFNDEAIGFLMKSKNLQIFMEDEEFLSAAFPSD